MKLTHVEIHDFQSIRMSNPFTVGDITCFVGKNEAGKTALFQALYRLNPLIAEDAYYDVTTDYPRTDVEAYRHALATGEGEPATVVTATYILDDTEVDGLRRELGDDVLRSRGLRLWRRYEERPAPWCALDVNEENALRILINKAGLPASTAEVLSSCPNLAQVLMTAREQPQSPELQQLIKMLSAIEQHGISQYLFETYLWPKVPKFLYFNQYYQLRGCTNIEALLQRQASGRLEPADYPLLGLLALAHLNVAELLDPQRTWSLKNILEGAGNTLTRRIIKYWSQNKHLLLRFDVRPAQVEDPEGMRQGTNLWTEIYDTLHLVTTELGSRSRGFVWFFSFLAWYWHIKNSRTLLILLLDEPGFSLHGKAQGDLLRYFEEEIQGAHQLLYTTQSPFMVDSRHFERVRIVEDKNTEADVPLPLDQAGTKVYTDVRAVGKESLFPLQGALGYELYHTLFRGPLSILVESTTELLYLQTLSSLLEEHRREGLDSRWVISPVGGAGKVAPFVALLGGQKAVTVVALINLPLAERKFLDQQSQATLFTRKHMLTFAEFIEAEEADIEDLFDPAFYLRLVNAEYGTVLRRNIMVSDLDPTLPRIRLRLEQYFEKNPLQRNTGFSPYQPARYLAENVGTVKGLLTKETYDRFERIFKALNALL